MEVLQTGQAATGFLASGDTVRIDMTGPDGLSVFGAIDQAVLTTRD
jgi:fumarylacetoacetate (FAA) hydrolase